MLLIFEGSDLSGKSTIAETVAKKLPETYLTKMCHRPKNNTQEEIDKVYKRYWNIVEWYKFIYTLSEGKDNMMRVNKMLDKWNKNTHGKDECPQCNGKHIIRYIDVAQIESRKMDVHYKL